MVGPMIRPLRVILACSALLLACGPKGSAPTTCATEESVCLPATGAAYCSNLSIDKANCGACGAVCEVPSGSAATHCNAGQCEADCGGYSSTTKVVCGVKGGGSAADAGAPLAYCTDLGSDHENCGACGNACTGQQQCTSGACTAVGTTACTGAGSSVTYIDLQTSHDNCGACGRACSASEACKAGACDPCPVAQCNNLCVDTQSDPANCGACGVTAATCENGTPLAKITIELLAPLSTNFVGAASSTQSISFKVHSGIRVARPSLKVAGAGAPVDYSDTLTAVTPVERSPVTFTGSFPVPTGSPTLTITLDAYDEQYLPSLGATANAAHTDEKIVSATVLAVPTAAVTNVAAASGATAIGTGLGCGTACKWVPLNAAPVTLSATVPTGQNIANMEFRSAAAGPVIGRAAVSASGAASLTITPPEVGKGDVAIYACPVDVVGQPGTCVAGPAFTVGRIAYTGTQPVVGKNLDGASHTIYWTFSDGTLYAQDFAQLNSNASGQPGAPVGTDKYYTTIGPTAEGSGILAVKNDGSAVQRIECPSAGCIKASFVLRPSATDTLYQVPIATTQAMLIADDAPAENSVGFFAQAKASQTSDTAVKMGTIMPAVAGGPAMGSTTSGAVVAWFSNGGNFAPALFHPAVSGNHVKQLMTPRGSLSGFTLQVFPGGEIVFQFTDGADNNRKYVGGAYFNGTADPVLLTPVPVGPNSGTSYGKNFMVAKTGVVLGHVPVQTDASKFEVLWLNVGTGAAPVRPAQFDGTSIGPVHATANVVNRFGAGDFFTVSDDKTRALFVTDDPPAAPSTQTVYRVRLIDLSNGSAQALGASERLVQETHRLPHFVRSSGAWVGGAPAGMHQVAVWAEQLPLANAPVHGIVAIPATVVRHERISFANFSGAVTVSTVDRNGAYLTPYPANFDTSFESASGGVLLFLSDRDGGGASLYSAPLNSPAGPVQATKVMDRVFGFKVREDKARLLVARSDGTLFFSALAPGQNLAQTLQPIAGSGPVGDVNYAGYDQQSFGFTPDGDHAVVAVDQTFDPVGGFYRGQLQTLDLASGARTNWGRIGWFYLGNSIAGFLANASVAAFIDAPSADSNGARLVVAKSSAPLVHTDTGLLAATATPSTGTNSVTTLDGNELLIKAGVGGAVVEKDGTFATYSVISDGDVVIPASNSPYGPAGCTAGVSCFRPEASRDDYITAGQTFASWKIWGGASPPAFVTVLRGATAIETAQTVITPDHSEIEYSFTSPSDSNGYVMVLPLSGKTPPAPLTP